MNHKTIKPSSMSYNETRGVYKGIVLACCMEGKACTCNEGREFTI